MTGGWRAKVVPLDPASFASGLPKALVEEDGGESLPLYCINDSLVSMILDCRWNAKYIALYSRPEVIQEADDEEGKREDEGQQENVPPPPQELAETIEAGGDEKEQEEEEELVRRSKRSRRG